MEDKAHIYTQLKDPDEDETKPELNGLRIIRGTVADAKESRLMIDVGLPVTGLLRIVVHSPLDSVSNHYGSAPDGPSRYRNAPDDSMVILDDGRMTHRSNHDSPIVIGKAHVDFRQFPI
jgi:hypothetical protein